jgi:hypothetical protein
MQMYKGVDAHVWGMEVPLDLHPSYTYMARCWTKNREGFPACF